MICPAKILLCAVLALGQPTTKKTLAVYLAHTVIWLYLKNVPVNNFLPKNKSPRQLTGAFLNAIGVTGALHHAAHATHTAHAATGATHVGFFFTRQIGDHTFGRDHQAGD